MTRPEVDGVPTLAVAVWIVWLSENVAFKSVLLATLGP